MWTVESGYFLIRCRHKIGASIYLANLKIAADRRQIASVLLGLISSLLACMQLNDALLNAEISYARRRLTSASSLRYLQDKTTGRNNLNEKESNAVLDDSWLDLDKPVPGGTILPILSESGVNPNTCGRANSI